MTMLHRIGVFLGLTLGLAPATAEGAEPPRLLIDGELDDWSGIAVLHADPADDASGGLDLLRCSASWDAERLYVHLELGAEIVLQDGNEVVLHIDGGGGELVWSFGKRRGRLLRNGKARQVTHGEIGLVTAPTVSAAAFEIVLEREARIDGRALLPGRRVKLAFANGGSGDRLPDRGFVAFEIGAELPPAVEPLALEKQRSSDLRILSYNTGDALFEPHRQAAYRRILRAVDPDLVLLQEVRSNTSREVRGYLTPTLGGPRGGGKWHHARSGGEASVLLSPFSIAAAWPLGESGAFLLDASQQWDTEIVLVALSAPCCARNRQRQAEIDRIMAFVRDAKTPGGVIDVDPNTPILLIGDANLVGHSRQRRTLLEGAIADVGRHGPAFTPDWDGSPFIDLLPRHTHGPFTFTWVGEDFPPARLDYAIFSDAVVDAVHGFVLFTPGMPKAVLEHYGLEHGDTATTTDHLPLVVDFALKAQSSTNASYPPTRSHR